MNLLTIPTEPPRRSDKPPDEVPIPCSKCGHVTMHTLSGPLLRALCVHSICEACSSERVAEIRHANGVATVQTETYR